MTLEDATLASSAAVRVVAVLDVVLEDATLEARAGVPLPELAAELAQVLEDATLEAAATVSEQTTGAGSVWGGAGRRRPAKDRPEQAPVKLLLEDAIATALPVRARGAAAGQARPREDATLAAILADLVRTAVQRREHVGRRAADAEPRPEASVEEPAKPLEHAPEGIPPRAIAPVWTLEDAAMLGCTLFAHRKTRERDARAISPRPDWRLVERERMIDARRRRRAA